ncbi:MAG: hypothetical protein CMQ46_03390 [Gammaproteobacteria bacterium]|nr:hypothetical protein [Gammaproteobacteria bacterium]MBJ54292.1 hypothetical protein [Gammaproteobacteria bacterium]HBN16285.1 hypothetical protein [Pseudohongiella sp.]|tara:strand:- start:2783 stop:3208 length:426 start_codon:yes stop_codon:yes gene_type:complete
MSKDKHTEITHLMQSIGETFSRLDFDAWLALFTTPRTIISKGNVFSSTSAEETRNKMMPVFDSLHQRGFAHTRLDKCHIKLLGDTNAMASTVWTRLDGNGDVIETLGATYTLVLADGAWKVAVVMSHRADVMAIPDQSQDS